MELEAEYDTEYANMVDKMRENNSQKNEISILSTINITNKEEDTESFKKEKIDVNDISTDIKLEITELKGKKEKARIADDH